MQSAKQWTVFFPGFPDDLGEGLPSGAGGSGGSGGTGSDGDRATTFPNESYLALLSRAESTLIWDRLLNPLLNVVSRLISPVS
jgi:hypothetical protein